MSVFASPLLWGALVLGGVAAYVFTGETGAEPISWGHDQCHYCKMAIVDKQHAAQLVTQKGKQFKYDAIECLVNEQREQPKATAIMLVSDYGATQMTPAETGFYLISPKLRSPMGADLSGFSTRARAEAAQKEYGGKIYSWAELKTLKIEAY